MLTRREVEGLSSYQNEEFPVISFYLNVPKGEADEGMTLIRMKNLLAEIEEQRGAWTKGQMDSIERDAERIRTFVRDEYAVGGGRGLVAFGCAADGWWHTYSFPRRLGDRLVIDDQPYVKPLLHMLDLYERYCTVLLDQGRARIFILHLDEIQERSDLFGAVPGRHDQGGWAQARLQRHRDDRVMRHLKNTAEQIFDLYQEGEFSKLLVAGTGEVTSQFQDYLHPYLKERLVGTLSLDVTTPTSKVQDETLSLLREFEQEEDEELLDELESQVGAQNLGVVGLSGTVRAMERGQVRTLLVNEGFSHPGYRCTSCVHLTLGDSERCDYCGGELEALDDIVHEVVGKAFSEGAKVRFMDGPSQERLAALGNIGALLRFTTGP